jgi:hypothetical protein
MFEEKSFKNFDLLRTKSMSRTSMISRAHVGISALNDRVRFNLYYRPQNRELENQDSIHRSPMMNFKITPGTNFIKNPTDLQLFADILNTLMHLSPACLTTLYEDFLLERNLKFGNPHLPISEEKNREKNIITQFRNFERELLINNKYI